MFPVHCIEEGIAVVRELAGAEVADCRPFSIAFVVSLSLSRISPLRPGAPTSMSWYEVIRASLRAIQDPPGALYRYTERRMGT